MVSTNQPTQCAGTVRSRLYDEHPLDSQQWGQMPDHAKVELLEQVEPVEEDVTENVTCTGLFEWIASCLDASTSEPNPVDTLALGRSDAPVDTSDTSLNDRVDEVSITSYADEGTQTRFTFFVGEAEANVDVEAGETLSECGLKSGSSLMNHALFNTEYEKDDTKTMTVEVVLSFSAP